MARPFRAPTEGLRQRRTSGQKRGKVGRHRLAAPVLPSVCMDQGDERLGRDDPRSYHPPGSDLTMEVERLIAGRYRIEKRLARGGQAAVYLARQEPLDRPVALKVLVPPADATDAEIQRFQDRFLLEARTLATLVHPNIVVVHDYGEINPGCFYIAMEYVAGKRFSDILRERPVDRQRLLTLIGQTAQALHYAHRRGIVHRDVKNSNILVNRDEAGEEVVKVVDFGIAKLMEQDPELTQVGVILGSPHFMAPEQAQGAALDHRTDLYAVGVLLYRALLNRYPFDGPNSTAILTSHIIDDVPAFADANPRLNIHPQLEDVVRRCLSKHPDDRFSDLNALLDALKPWMDGAVPIRLPLGGSVGDGTPDVAVPLQGTAANGPAHAQSLPMGSTPVAATALSLARPSSLLLVGMGVVLALLLVALGVLIGLQMGQTAPPPAAPVQALSP